MRIAAIGLRAKTGRAIAVILAGDHGSPSGVRRADLPLASPDFPATLQPYHEVLGLPWERASREVERTEQVIVSLASANLRSLVDEAAGSGLSVCGVGIAGAPERDLLAIKNPHIRAHAGEGVLFRRVLERAAESLRMNHVRFDERELENLAVRELKLSVVRLTRWLEEFGKTIGRPWRRDEKAAATAAWLALRRYGGS